MTIVTSCDSLIVILIFSTLILENELKRHVRNVAGIKCGFVKLVVIFLLLIQNY